MTEDFDFREDFPCSCLMPVVTLQNIVHGLLVIFYHTVDIFYHTEDFSCSWLTGSCLISYTSKYSRYFSFCYLNHLISSVWYSPWWYQYCMWANSMQVDMVGLASTEKLRKWLKTDILVGLYCFTILWYPWQQVMGLNDWPGCDTSFKGPFRNPFKIGHTLNLNFPVMCICTEEKFEKAWIEANSPPRSFTAWFTITASSSNHGYFTITQSAAGRSWKHW
jgi:hypothetical protein